MGQVSGPPMVKPHSCSASVRLGLRVWMRCSQGRIFSTLATDTVSTKMMCSPWRSNSQSRVWVARLVSSTQSRAAPRKPLRG